MSLDNLGGRESVFTYAAPALKFGRGASREIGYDVSSWGARRVLLLTDPGVVAVGGGSAVDTAKAVALMVTNPGELMDYINAPVGRARAPQNPVLPLVAVPTTTGTGSESTTICVMDVLSLKVKTGISHAALRPKLAVVDPALSVTQPPGVVAAAGMDILCHALESCTARWFGEFDAGVHAPHANAYPVAGRVREFRPADYPQREPIVPHGMAVSLTAPEAFRFTFDAAPERHLRAAQLLDPSAEGGGADAADVLPRVLAWLMRDLKIPNGLGEVGHGEPDVDDLVEGAMKQQRMLATAPKEVTPDDLAGVITGSMELW